MLWLGLFKSLHHIYIEPSYYSVMKPDSECDDVTEAINIIPYLVLFFEDFNYKMKITRHVGKHTVYLILRDEMRCHEKSMYICIACQITKNLNLFPFTCILRRINYYHTSVRKYNMNACVQCHNIETWKIGCKNNKLPLRFFLTICQNLLWLL